MVIHFQAKHIPGKHNITADRLSRFEFQAAFEHIPQLNHKQTPIPETMLETVTYTQSENLLTTALSDIQRLLTQRHLYHSTIFT